MSDAFQLLLSDHAIAALDRQLHLAEVIGGRPWRADLAAGTLSFGDDLTFAAQLLGTQSDETDTFIWAWDHPSRPAHTSLAEAVRAAGHRLGVPVLVARQVDVTDTVHAHTLAMVAVGLTGADGYYRGPYPGGGGAAVLLIQDPAFPRPAVEHPLLHATTIMTEAISTLDIDQPRAIAAYLRQLGMTVESTGAMLMARNSADAFHAFTATFDDRGLLTNMTMTAGPK